MSKRASIRVGWAATLVGAVVLAVTPAIAGAHPPGHFRGVVAAKTSAGRALVVRLHGRHRAAAHNLAYNGGPVMHSDANYTIYWEPSGFTTSSSYKDTIDTYFTNVGAASGATTNDYSVATQYSDGSGPIAYNATFGRRIVDTNPYPPSGCASGSGPCITDAQLQTELARVVSADGLPTGLGTEYFVYFPAGVTTCFDSSGAQCSANVYCAYHSSMSAAGGATILYADMPYAGVSGCESGEYPNGAAAADSALNVTSHENIETITDPLGSAWYDSSGNEIGDKCNFNFGSPLGGAPGSEFNEQISGGDYWLQQEWSNAISGCAQRF